MAQSWAQVSGIDSVALRSFIILIMFFGVRPWILAVYRLYFHPLKDFPGPKEACVSHKWLYNRSLERFPEETFERLHKKYETKALRIAPNELHITDIHSYKVIYNQIRPFPKHAPFYDGFNTPHTLFAETDPALHKERRRMLNPLFSHQGVFRLEPVLQTKLSLLLDKLDRLCGQGTVNVYDAFRTLTTEIIMEFAFARSANMINEQEQSFDSWFLRGFDVAAQSILEMQYRPLLRKVSRKIPRSIIRTISPEIAMILEIQDFAASSMNHWQKNGNNTDHPVLFDRLTLLSDEDKVHEAMDILIAGADTTASTLTTGLAHILAKPAVNSKLREALAAVPIGPDGRLAMQDLEKCSYLAAVVKECIRIGMAVPGRLPRVVPEGERFMVDNKLIPVGTVVSMSTYTMHTSTEAWGPDAREFNPERWLGPNAQGLESWMCTFSKGARMCIGQNFAPAEISLALAYLFTRYRLRLPTNARHSLPRDLFTLTYPLGLDVVFEKL
ncbi:cytochrome P450 [Aspergillus filifer]